MCTDAAVSPGSICGGLLDGASQYDLQDNWL